MEQGDGVRIPSSHCEIHGPERSFGRGQRKSVWPDGREGGREKSLEPCTL